MAIDRLLRAQVDRHRRRVGQDRAWLQRLERAQGLGFTGEIHLVNPSRSELLGQTCHRLARDVPGELDAVFIAVQADKVLDVAREAAAKGAGGLAMLSSGFAEAGEQGAAMQRELARSPRRTTWPCAVRTAWGS